MYLACRDDLLSPSSFDEKFKLASELGFDALELHGSNIWGREKEICKARDKGAVFSNIAAGFWGSLADKRKAEREKACLQIKHFLTFSAEIGAAGVIIIPFWGLPFSPFTPRSKIEFAGREFGQQMNELCETAEKLSLDIFLEPVNRYESPMFNSLEEMADLIERIACPNLKLLADFFHMNIEESSLAQSILRWGKLIGMVHLADSNRLPPGYGHLDFSKPVRQLREIAFDGCLSFECRGEINEEMLRNGVKCIRSQII